MDNYLRPTEVIDSDAPPIREKALWLTEGKESDRERAIALYYFVRDSIRHEPYAAGFELTDYIASGTLQKGYGFCTHKSILLVALARAAGIPARIGFADIRDHLLSYKFRKMIGGNNLLIYHGYAELRIDGRWVHASPAVDAEACRQSGFVPVEFDGANDYRDSPVNQKGRKHIEWVQDRGTRDDFPWDEIRVAAQEFWAKLGKSFEEGVGKGWGRNPEGEG
jgi:transglutaminase-like putative cysteine protease